MSIGRLVRTVRYLKLRQICFQVWRRVQKAIGPHPKCGDGKLPEFTFLNLTAKPKGWNDASLDMLWRYNLHYFDYLNGRVEGSGEVVVGRCSCRKDGDTSTLGLQLKTTTQSPTTTTHSNLILQWIAENPKGSIPGWDPYPTSLRIINWIKWLNNISASSASLRLCVKQKMEDSLKEQAAYLRSHLEYHLLANHLLANAKALVFAGKYFERKDWYEKGMSIYRKQLPEQILPDGGHFERSVMYHAIILEDVLDVVKFCGDGAAWLRPVAEKMLRYLVNMTGPDGKIAMFNDAADGIAKSTEWLVGYAKGLGVETPNAEPFVDFPDTGYTRMMAGDFVLFVDSAPIGPDYQPGHAHADTLTYELYYKGRKVVTDVGTSEYRGKRRAYERSTAAHNVVEVGGRNSSEVWSSHRVGARARIAERKVEPGRIFAAHNGYGFKVARELVLTENGLEVKETVNGRGECVTRAHVCSTAQCVKYTKGEKNAKLLELAIEGLDNIEEFEYAVEFGKLEKGACLSRSFDGGELCYSIKKDCSPTV